MRETGVSVDRVLAALCVLTLTAGAYAQTGRMLSQQGMISPGMTSSVSMTYPGSATGNWYSLLWSSPPHGGTSQPPVPGVTVQGSSGLNPTNCVSTFSGLLGPSGVVSHALTVPTNAGLVGYTWEMQSIDLNLTSNTLFFSDNELLLTVVQSESAGQ